MIEERDEEIRKVVETIAELAQIMRDLSVLVVEQGTMLDRIDHNVTTTAMKVGACCSLCVVWSDVGWVPGCSLCGCTVRPPAGLQKGCNSRDAPLLSAR
jgi:hypothetical protein